MKQQTNESAPVSSGAFEKRVKRRIGAREHTFYISTAPGLIGLVEKEVAEVLGVEAHRLIGGVSFTGRLELLWKSALTLRMANRILVRVGTFKAQSFEKLVAKCDELPWELWLPSTASIEVSVSCHHCKLYHSGAIEERVKKVVEGKLTGKRHGSVQRITVRGEDDNFTISLDATGEALYKRDIKTHGGRAPIRETLAAAILTLAGYTADSPLVDPMCGAGTFSLEAAMVATNTAPGMFRRFAFETWPSFKPKTFSHMRSELDKGRISAPSLIIASDGEPQAVAHLKEALKTLPFGDSITCRQGDFFKLDPAGLTEIPGFVVFNPPYGKRIKGGGTDLVVRLLARLSSHWKGWQVAIAVPKSQIPRPIPKGLTLHPMAHGGLELSVIVGRV